MKYGLNAIADTISWCGLLKAVVCNKVLQALQKLHLTWPLQQPVMPANLGLIHQNEDINLDNSSLTPNQQHETCLFNSVPFIYQVHRTSN